jgi:hypothetical protein
VITSEILELTTHLLITHSALVFAVSALMIGEHGIMG